MQRHNGAWTSGFRRLDAELLDGHPRVIEIDDHHIRSVDAARLVETDGGDGGDDLDVRGSGEHASDGLAHEAPSLLHHDPKHRHRLPA